MIEEKSTGINLHCPKCGIDITRIVTTHIEQLTGIPANDFQDGNALKELSFKLKIAELTLAKAGNSIDQAAIANEVREWAEKLLSKRLSQEQEQKYNSAIESLKQELMKEKEHHIEQLGFLKEALQTEKGKSNDLKKELDELQAEQTYVPSISGGTAEEEIAQRLRSIAPYDELSLKQRHQGSTDILIKVKATPDSEIIVSKICIESKKVSKWEDNFIQESKEHARKEGTQYIIIATTVMPSDAINSNMDCFRSGVWIVPLYALEFAYAAYRKVILITYDMQKRFDKEIELLKKEKTVAEQLKSILTTEAFKKYAEIATGLLCQADHLEDDARAMINYVQVRNTRFHNVADSVRKLANEMVEQSDEIQKQIRGAIDDREKAG